MRVVDCLGESFTAHCRALSDLAIPDYSPDLVVAIRQGGLHVAREMLSDAASGIGLVTVAAHRPGTAVKRRLDTAIVVRRLPRSLANGLRILEHYARLYLGSGSQPPTVEVDSATRLRVAASARILVVDDAVDSGTTLDAVLRHLAALGRAEIRTAVLTVTFPQPAVLPDYTVYPKGVLLRFPWSDDADVRG
jgi:hypoxanthine phosphoribosyltransferase